MPELPEVEIARRNLERWTAGHRIAAVRVRDPSVVRAKLSSRPSDALAGGDQVIRDALTGSSPQAPLRRGKRLGWAFSAPDAAVLVHLGMTGKWVHRPTGEAPRHARLGLDLDEGSTVWFVDTRRFGCVTPVAPTALRRSLAAGLGPDALEEPPDALGLQERLSGRRAIKVALLDQGRLAGLGNIHATEVLWRARVHPGARADCLDESAWSRLAEIIPAHLARVVAGHQSDDIRYVQEPGADNPFAAYGRAGQPCPRCGAGLGRFVLGGRASFFCPTCQPPA
jgi:formamidopyrimidine-DNA glycosylase